MPSIAGLPRATALRSIEAPLSRRLRFRLTKRAGRWTLHERHCRHAASTGNRAMTQSVPQLITIGQTEQGPLQMELYLPTGFAGPRPGVLFVHGGGWGGGHRGQFRWHAGELAKHGYVTATTSYRLMQAATYPAALDDCQRAVRWLRSRAGELALDPRRLGAMGSSAGGHLVACLGVRDTRLDAAQDDPALRGQSSKVQCVVDVHGVHDFLAMDKVPLGKTCANFIGGPLAERRALWEDASPIRFVDKSSAPTLLIHAPDDPTVPYDESVTYETALKKAGVATKFIPTPGSGHGFVYGPDNPHTKAVWPESIAWFNTYLKP
ncbi:MAG: alpha/beta hydrolase [Planctomycetota bacterium]|nr:alpha/beta hydrolase [Planctomycetota bacterium]